MKLNKNFVTRFLSVLFIFLFIFSASPQKTLAVYGVADVVVDPTNLVQNTVTAVASPITATMTTLEKVKHYVLDPLAWRLSKLMVQRITSQTVNWINSGFDGNPAYVTDPGRFFLGVADTEASRFLSSTALNQLCSPFRSEVRLALVQNYINDGENFSCTLSILRGNFDSFTRDFSEGGWDGWYEVTQNRQNNPIGAYLSAKSQLDIRIGNQQTKYQNQLQQGRGFLSYQRCPEGQVFTGPTVPPDPDYPGPTDDLQPGDCLVELQTVTPGSVIETQLQRVLPAGIEQLQLADSFNELVNALVSQLFTQVVGGTGNGGLFGATDSIPVPDLPPPGVPYIRVLGDNPFRVEEDADYRDPGAVAIDDVDGDITDNIVVTGYILTPIPGSYTLTYTVTNSAGVTVSATRTIIVGNYVTPGGGGTGGGGTTPPPPPPMSGAWNISGNLDIGSVNIVGPAPDVRGWAETTQITSGSWNGNWSIDFTQKNSWGSCETPGVFGPVQYTIWAFVRVNGQWYGSSFERDYVGDGNSGGPGDPKFQLPRNWWYDSRWTNMFGHYPTTGEQVGFMVTNGNHRMSDSPCTTSQSRSNIVLVTMP